jgi:hypothetical protein
MDWIETWFGISPDGGDGSAEWLIVLVGVAVFIAVVPAFRRRVWSLRRSAVATPAAAPKANR